MIVEGARMGATCSETLRERSKGKRNKRKTKKRGEKKNKTKRSSHEPSITDMIAQRAKEEGSTDRSCQPEQEQRLPFLS
jgi:hypothetical protein